MANARAMVLSLYDITVYRVAHHVLYSLNRFSEIDKEDILNSYCTTLNDHTMKPYNEITAFAFYCVRFTICHLDNHSATGNCSNSEFPSTPLVAANSTTCYQHGTHQLE